MIGAGEGQAGADDEFVADAIDEARGFGARGGQERGTYLFLPDGLRSEIRR